jgi:hypothetical protein
MEKTITKIHLPTPFEIFLSHLIMKCLDNIHEYKQIKYLLMNLILSEIEVIQIIFF